MSEIELDCRGMLCPMPVIKLAGATQGAEPDTVVRLRTDDAAARVDVPAWCRMRRHELVHQHDDPDSTASTFEVRVRREPGRT
ncbi:sulfurtransferase TusA family protein [Solicola gregarius]|uniref:Sulfurtransferase TusA family protein n=1 Tax=Solicola gregarius TaxID=2908642 RepID=A0AA46TID7_9ACTN|nr:sulfurtransferase TusA family protein [Solicola gregarius]UYM05419.1 sulfurtransferase TusA family protein [Solicola gregarius]